MGRRGVLVVALLLAIGAGALRSVDLEGGQFRGDEGLHLVRADQIAQGLVWPSTGMRTTDGLPTPAVFHYLLAVPTRLLGPDPLGVMRVIVLLNALAVGLLVFAAAKRYGLGAAVFAGALLAVSPGLVLYSRKIWNPDVLLPFAALTLALAMLELRRRDGRAAGGALFVSIVATAVHYSGVSLVALAAASWWAPAGAPVRERLRQRGPWLGLAGGLLLLVPFLTALLGGAGEAAPEPLAGQPRGPLAAILLLRDVFGTGEAFRIVGPGVTAQLGLAPLFALADALVLWVVAAGVAVVVRARHPLARVHQIWLATAVLPLVLGVVPARGHYALLALPPLALAGGLALARLARSRVPRAQRLVTKAGSLLLATLASVSLSTLSILKDRGGDPNAPYGVRLADKQAAVARVLDQDLALAEYPALEYLLLAHLSGRRSHATVVHRQLIPYWNVEVALPVPQFPPGPNQLAAIRLGGEGWEAGPFLRVVRVR